MPSINEFVHGILTPAQHAQISKWLLTGNNAAISRNSLSGNRSARKTAPRTAAAKKTAPRSRTAKPTQQTLIDFYATNPGGWSLSDLAAKTSIKPNILGRVLNAKNSPFRKNDDLWLMNQGPSATVSRKLTAGARKAA
jgi:hypothetical protein